MQGSISPLESLLRRDRTIVFIGLFGVVALSWAYMLYLAQDMGSMMIPLNVNWTVGDFAFQYGMWAFISRMATTETRLLMILALSWHYRLQGLWGKVMQNSGYT